MVKYNGKDYLDFDTTMYLIENGYEKISDVWWRSSLKISDKIIDKFPGLSDDGYYELTKEHGGEYDFSDIYEKVNIIDRNPFKAKYENFICQAIDPYEAWVWLLENKYIYISIFHITGITSKNKLLYVLSINKDGKEVFKMESSKYFAYASDAIEDAISIIMKNKMIE